MESVSFIIWGGDNLETVGWDGGRTTVGRIKISLTTCYETSENY
jgi:hypothetical protein